MPATAQTIECVKYYSPSGSFRIEPQMNGKFAVRGVPIFAKHTRDGLKYDDEWMIKACGVQEKLRKDGFLPRATLGHNSDDIAQEKPAAAFWDKYRYDPSCGLMFADLVDISPELKGDIESNKWPGRSVEVNHASFTIPVVSLLGGRSPYFKLPDLRFADPELAKYRDDTSQNILVVFQSPEGVSKMSEAITEPKADTSTAKYAELDAQHRELTAKYAEQAKQIEELSARVIEQEEATEKAVWTTRYNEKRIPAGRLNLVEEVKFLMELPKPLRAKYFDRSISNLSAPSTKPADAVANASGEAPPLARGTDAYFRAYSEFAGKQENIAKHGTDMVALRRAFESEIK